MTDVTGFGLVGHLHELCSSSGLAAVLDANAVPSITGALDLAADPECRAGGSRRNDEYAQTFTVWNVSDEWRVLLTDAMTSGGLLAAIPADCVSAAPGVCIGAFVPGTAGRIEVT
jgi:selenide,water dikinase